MKNKKHNTLPRFTRERFQVSHYGLFIQILSRSGCCCCIAYLFHFLLKVQIATSCYGNCCLIIFIVVRARECASVAFSWNSTYLSDNFEFYDLHLFEQVNAMTCVCMLCMLGIFRIIQSIDIWIYGGNQKDNRIIFFLFLFAMKLFSCNVLIMLCHLISLRLNVYCFFYSF